MNFFAWAFRLHMHRDRYAILLNSLHAPQEINFVTPPMFTNDDLVVLKNKSRGTNLNVLRDHPDYVRTALGGRPNPVPGNLSGQHWRATNRRTRIRI